MYKDCFLFFILYVATVSVFPESHGVKYGVCLVATVSTQSLVPFYIFIFNNKSHEKGKTTNKLISQSFVCVAKVQYS